MAFGKDYRLVGEATVTGEKYRAGTAFWSALAHTDIVGRIKLMVEHYAVVGDRIDKPLIYDRDEMIKWLSDRTGNCLKCYPYYVSGELTGKSTTDHKRFKSEFFAKMSEIGLGWREFQLYFHSDLNRFFRRNPEPDEQDWVETTRFMKFDGQDRTDELFIECIEPKNFVDVLDEISANRRQLHGLPVASK